MAATLLPLLLCAGLRLEAHDHGALLETGADGGWEHLCVVGHSGEGRPDREGLESTAAPHRHSCAACRLSAKSRAFASPRFGPPTVLVQTQDSLDSAAPPLRPARAPLPPQRGPPLP